MQSLTEVLQAVLALTPEAEGRVELPLLHLGGSIREA